MKRRLLFFLLMCYSPVQSQVISLAVGNEYFGWIGSFSEEFTTPSGVVGGPATSISYLEKIVGDTIINGRQYVVYGNRWPLRFERCDSSKVYVLKDGAEVVTLDYTVTVGSTISVRGYNLVVESDQRESLFADTQRVITATNVRNGFIGKIIRYFKGEPDVTVKYATKYGLVLFTTKEAKATHSERLAGGILNGSQFGMRYRNVDRPQ